MASSNACVVARTRLQEVHDQALKTTATEKIRGAIRTGLFGSLKTLQRAAGGNVLSGALRTGVNPIIRAGLDAATETQLSKRVAFMPKKADYGALKEGFKDGWTPMIEAWKSNKGTTAWERIQKFVDDLRVNLVSDTRSNDNLIANLSRGEAGAAAKKQFKRVIYKSPVMQTIHDGVMSALEAVDRPIWQAVHDFAYSLKAHANAQREIPYGTADRAARVEEAYQRWLRNPTDEMLASTVAEANYALFKNDTQLAKFANDWKRGLAKGADDPKKSAWVRPLYKASSVGLEAVIPATGVPSAVTAQAFAHTPVGAFVKAAAAASTGEREVMLDAVAQGLVGVGGIALGIKWVKDGFITGALPADPVERDRWSETGKQPFSYKFPGMDSWHNYSYLGPGVSGIAAGATLYGAFKGMPVDANWEQKATVMATAPVKFAMGQAYLEGLNRTYQGFSGERGASVPKTLANILPIPSAIRTTAGAIDPRDLATDDAKDMIIRGIPGASLALDEKVSPFAATPKPKSLMDRLVPFIDPSRTTEDRSNAITNEMERLDVPLSGMSKSLEGKRLAPAIVRGMDRKLRDLVQVQLPQLFKDPDYLRDRNGKPTTDAEKAKTVRRVLKSLRDQVRKQYQMEPEPDGDSD